MGRPIQVVTLAPLNFFITLDKAVDAYLATNPATKPTCIILGVQEYDLARRTFAAMGSALDDGDNEIYHRGLLLIPSTWNSCVFIGSTTKTKL